VLAKLFDPLVAWMAPRYQAVVAKELRKYGLRYEDLYDPQLDLVRRAVLAAVTHGPVGDACSALAWLARRGGLRHSGRAKPAGCLHAAFLPSLLTARNHFSPRSSSPQDVDEALKRLPQDVVDARNQRLKRAHDLNMKHSELPADLQQLQTPYQFYVKDTLELVRLENDERLALGTGKPYERQLP
jgi:hypothetical protein